MTGADKEYVFHRGYTQISITTCGMMWQWLAQPDGHGRINVLREHSAFLLGELAGTRGREEVDTRTDPQFLEVARILAAEVWQQPEWYRFLATGAYLEHFSPTYTRPRGAWFL